MGGRASAAVFKAGLQGAHPFAFRAVRWRAGGWPPGAVQKAGTACTNCPINGKPVWLGIKNACSAGTACATSYRNHSIARVRVRRCRLRAVCLAQCAALRCRAGWQVVDGECFADTVAPCPRFALEVLSCTCHPISAPPTRSMPWRSCAPTRWPAWCPPMATGFRMSRTCLCM